MAWTPDESWLKKVAAQHLDRYPTTRAHLARVLRRRIDRTVQRHGGDAPALKQKLPGVLDWLEGLRILDDRAYVQAKVRSLHRKGNSGRAIQAKLAAKLAPRELVDEALAGLNEGSEFRAAAAYIRRRRFGPYHTDSQKRQDRRQKELASLARAGFSFDVARTVLDVPDLDQLLERVDAEHFY